MPIPGKKKKLKGQTVVRAEHGSPLAKLTESTGGTGGIADAIKPGGVTGDKIAGGAITGDKIASGSVTGDNISNSTITNNHIVSVDGSKISDNSVTNSKIVSVNGGKIADGSITASKLGADALYTHPNHTGDVTSSGDGATTIAAGAVTSAKIAAGAVGSTQIATGAVTSSEIADGAVTSSEIATGAVTNINLAADSVDTTKFLTTGSTAISLNSVMPKTLTLHVGNYKSAGTARLASDLLNYNAATDLYGIRSLNIIPFSSASHPSGWEGHYDIESCETIEPFATVVAAARYAVQNFGIGISVMILIHGHVSFGGDYDMTSGSYKLPDVNNWEPFDNVYIQGAPHMMGSTSDWGNQTWNANRTTIGRIDFDCDPITVTNRVLWFRGPSVNIRGINLNFKRTSAKECNMMFSRGRGASGIHQVFGTRAAALGSINYFEPFIAGEVGKLYFSSGSNAPNEWYFGGTGGGNILKAAGAGSTVLYSNNSGSNTLLVNGSGNNQPIHGITIESGATVQWNHPATRIKWASGFSPSTTLNSSINIGGGHNKLVMQSNITQWFGGNGTAYNSDALAPASTGNGYNIYTGRGSSQFYEGGAQQWIQTYGSSTFRQSYTPSTEPNTLLNMAGNAAGYKTASIACSPDTLSGHGSFKVAPTTRTNNPYSDQV